MNKSCPVCGYPNLALPPEQEGMICPCCGTEFGYDDQIASHEELRRGWLLRGAPWFSRYTQPPPGWNAAVQLLKAGFGYESRTASSSDAHGNVSLPQLRSSAPPPPALLLAMLDLSRHQHELLRNMNYSASLRKCGAS